MDLPNVIEIAHRSVLDRPVDEVVSPANSFGFMDGGLDWAYLQFFRTELLPSHEFPAALFEDLWGTMSVRALAPGQDLEPGGGLCATSLSIFKEGSNSGGHLDSPDRIRRSLLKSMSVKGRIWTSCRK